MEGLPLSLHSFKSSIIEMVLKLGRPSARNTRLVEKRIIGLERSVSESAG